jgi:cardiolipin synthase
LQKTFAADWAFTTQEILSGEAWFPEFETQGEAWARGISHGPDEDFEVLYLTTLAALTVAQSRVYVCTPYFLPDAALINALNVAAMRGVDVRIILPAENNIKLVHWASTALWWQLLERGCRIWLSQPPFDHTKLMLIDDIWSLVGSTNWDPRALRLNFEFNVECYDRDLNARLTKLCERKLERSSEVKFEDVEHRSIPVRLRDGAARLVSPYL